MELSFTKYGMEDFDGNVPLGWVASHPDLPYANLGDAISPLVVSALSGKLVRQVDFDAHELRLIAVGTIGQEQRNGRVHVWGSGLDGRRNICNPHSSEYEKPEGTEFIVHAVRGPISRMAYERAGVRSPVIYGDPGWFLPKLMHPKVAKKYSLGVVVHISELERPHPNSNVIEEYVRYSGGEMSGIKIINTFHEPTIDGMQAKVAEILECERIASTSFHGLVLAEAYNLPCIYFPDTFSGFRFLNLAADEDLIDHRFLDFFLGIGARKLASFGWSRASLTPWDQLIEAIDLSWEPLRTDMRPLYDAFPLPKVVTYEQPSWILPDGFQEAIKL